MTIIVRNSADHFSEIARIDSRHDRIFLEARKSFELANPGVIVAEDPKWLRLLIELEEARQEDLALMRMWLVDDYARH